MSDGRQLEADPFEGPVHGAAGEHVAPARTGASG
jgi:hypothetical protein